MNKKVHNKLIRDKIPEILKKHNIKFKVSNLDDKQFSKALKNKLLEEVIELRDAKSKEELLEELADVKEVFENIIGNQKISLKDVIEKQQKKRTERGAFNKKLLLKYTEE